MARTRINNWKYRQAQRARVWAKWAAKQKRDAKPSQTKISKEEFLDALTGTCGIQLRICERLGITRNTLMRTLARPDWADMRQALEDERENGIDRAEDALRYIVDQRVDLHAAGTAAWRILTTMRRTKYPNVTKMELEGGDKPIRTENVNVNASVPIETLNLSLDVKRQILAALELKEEEDRAAKLNPAAAPQSAA